MSWLSDGRVRGPLPRPPPSRPRHLPQLPPRPLDWAGQLGSHISFLRLSSLLGEEDGVCINMMLPLPALSLQIGGALPLSVIRNLVA